MTLNDVFGSIYSMKLSDLIPLTSIQTDEDKKNHKDGYYFIFTESEWKKNIHDDSCNSHFLCAAAHLYTDGVF